MCGQDLSTNRLRFVASRWKPGHGSGDPEMPARGEPKYGASRVLTALMFPRVYSVFFLREKSYVMSRYVSNRSLHNYPGK